MADLAGHDRIRRRARSPRGHTLPPPHSPGRLRCCLKLPLGGGAAGVTTCNTGQGEGIRHSRGVGWSACVLGEIKGDVQTSSDCGESAEAESGSEGSRAAGDAGGGQRPESDGEPRGARREERRPSRTRPASQPAYTASPPSRAPRTTSRTLPASLTSSRPSLISPTPRAPQHPPLSPCPFFLPSPPTPRVVDSVSPARTLAGTDRR